MPRKVQGSEIIWGCHWETFACEVIGEIRLILAGNMNINGCFAWTGGGLDPPEQKSCHSIYCIFNITRASIFHITEKTIAKNVYFCWTFFGCFFSPNKKNSTCFSRTKESLGETAGSLANQLGNPDATTVVAVAKQDVGKGPWQDPVSWLDPPRHSVENFIREKSWPEKITHKVHWLDPVRIRCFLLPIRAYNIRTTYIWYAL